jgi:hypothetical protein
LGSRALEAELLHAALELPDRQVGILHRQRSERLEPGRPLAHLLREEIVRAPRDLVRLRRVGDCLNRRCVQRQQRELDAVLVHEPQALLVDVEQAPAELRPDAVGEEAGRVAQRLRDREVLFEGDLSLHVQTFRNAGQSIAL